MPRIKKLIVEKVLTDEEVKRLKGQFIDESYMKHPLVQKNIDVCRRRQKAGDEKKWKICF